MSMKSSSIKRRLVTVVLITQLLLTIGVVTVAVVLTKRQLRNSFDAGLHGRAMSVAALVRYSEDEQPTLVFDREMVPPPLDLRHPDLYRIIDQNGKVLAASDNWPINFDPAPHGNRNNWNLKLQGEMYRAVRLKDVPVLDQEPAGTANSDARLTVFYAASTEELSESAWRVGILIGLASVTMLAIATMAVLWGIKRGLSPLAILASRAADVSPANWELRAPPEALQTSELMPLTQAMTTMLANLQQAFTSQRAFLADAAHELKTPVAIVKSTIQSLLQRPRSAEEYREGIEAALEDIERLEKLVHSMLRLARAEQWASSSLRRDLGEIDLTSTCELSVAHLRPLAKSRKLQIDFQRNGSPKLHADAEDLELVWGNLLENAIQYSPPGSSVLMTVVGRDSTAEVSVKDAGQGIPPAEIPHIFDRFHRADTSRARNTGGYGLGLAISKAIVEAYGGTIQVESELGMGTTMTVRLRAIS
jgi:two-component system, OmpR family, sensor kinase